MRAFADLVTIGRVVKPQGRKGEILVEPLSDRPERFPTLARVYLPAGAGAARETAVCSVWPHRGRFVLKLDGVDSIDAAEELRGVDLRVGEEELPPLPAGSYYHHQLRGLRVEDGEGQSLGVVADLMDTGSAPVLVVRGPCGETLIPLAEPFLRSIDICAGRIVVSVPETVEC